MKNFNVFLKLFLLVSFLSSCGKNDQNNAVANDQNTLVIIEPEFVEYFGIYNIGSWWVYRDEVSGGIDSVYVTDYSRSKKVEKHGTPETEVIDIKMRWHNRNEIEYFTSTASLDPDKFRFRLAYPIGVGADVIKENGEYKALYPSEDSVKLIDSITIGGIKYDNVIYFKGGYYNEVFYFVKNIGIIKRERGVGTGGDRIYNLLRYKVQR